MNGMDNDRHFLWRSLVGPYWRTEVFLFEVVGLGVLAFVAWKLLVVLAPVISAAKEAFEDSRMQWERERQELVWEKEQEAAREQMKRAVEEKRQQFLALPEAERHRILAEEKRLQDEKRRLAEEQYFEFQHKQQAEKKAQADERARLAAIANSPEAKKKRAMSDLTGEGY